MDAAIADLPEPACTLAWLERDADVVERHGLHGTAALIRRRVKRLREQLLPSTAPAAAASTPAPAPRVSVPSIEQVRIACSLAEGD